MSHHQGYMKIILSKTVGFLELLQNNLFQTKIHIFELKNNYWNCFSNCIPCMLSSQSKCTKQNLIFSALGDGTVPYNSTMQ